MPIYCPNQEERRDPKLYASNVRTKVAHHLSVPLANVAMEDRFNKKNKENLSDNEDNIQENNTGEKDIELLTIEKFSSLAYFPVSCKNSLLTLQI